jgi:hypothetical protein
MTTATENFQDIRNRMRELAEHKVSRHEYEYTESEYITKYVEREIRKYEGAIERQRN